ncbi:MAG: IS3 family transposase, partial [Culicoidibacterales bacterium]
MKKTVSCDASDYLDANNERFFGHENEFETLEDLQLAIETYIEYYNT